MTFFKNRSVGTLLHITSLPGEYGIGEAGVEAIKFLDFLKNSGQSLWQILPLGPTGYADSPYQCHSTFANNIYLTCVETLINSNLITKAEASKLITPNTGKVDFGTLIPKKLELLKIAAKRFLEQKNNQDYEVFKVTNSFWLNDFAVYWSIKQANHLKPWFEWEAGLRNREDKALADYTENNSNEIELVKAQQFLIHEQLVNLKSKANQMGIKIIGDLPIVVAHDSADVWANRNLFKLDLEGNPTVIAGVPPDDFSADGQRWGNPIYNWEQHKNTNFDWWCERMAHTLKYVDIIRLDHFRGLAALWEIDANCPTAVDGAWIPAPGDELLEAVSKFIGEVPIIAEDLGVITEDVVQLRTKYNLPGLRIAQMGFGSEKEKGYFFPTNYSEDSVAYTGTHDNDTMIGWINSVAGVGNTYSESDLKQAKNFALESMQATPENINWKVIEAVLNSKSIAAIIPMQDYLGLGSEARMNTPATSSGNWVWRMKAEQIDVALEERLLKLVSISRR